VTTPNTGPGLTPKDQCPEAIPGAPETTTPSGKKRQNRQALIDRVANLTESVLADPSHPWNREWPTIGEMAETIGSNHRSVNEVLRILGERGLYAKAAIKRQRRVSEGWVPTRRLKASRRTTDNEILAGIIDLARSGEWTILPTYDDLEEYFQAPRSAITRVVKELARRNLLIRQFYRGYWRWRLTVAASGPNRINPALGMTPSQRAIADLTRRLREGEFRYRTPDGVIHEEPFLSSLEIATQYRISRTTAKAVLHQLLRNGWLIREHQDAPCTLSDRIPAADRPHAAPPRQRPAKGNGRKRAGQLAKALAERIEAGEFSAAGFPSGAQLMTEYRTSRPIIQQVLDELHRRGLIEFEWIGGHRQARLAKSQREHFFPER